MIGIFLKELRENAKWAALIFGGFLIIVYFQVRSAPPYLMFSLAQPPQIVQRRSAAVYSDALLRTGATLFRLPRSALGEGPGRSGRAMSRARHAVCAAAARRPAPPQGRHPSL